MRAMILGRPPDLPRNRELGQTMLIVLLVLGFFLLAGAGFAVDVANLWFHRQTAQNAADAGCTAGAMDMLAVANGAASAGGFTAGTAFNCSTTSSAAPCQYAAFNGYSAPGLTAGTPSNEVKVTFPSSVAGVPACTGTPPPSVCSVPSSLIAHPYIQVNVIDRVQVFFSALLTGNRTVDVGAVAACGMVYSNAPIPIAILNPTVSGALSLSGSQTKISVYGGPVLSIQVNSSSATAVIGNGNPVIDLSQAGPNLNGGTIGITGGPSSPPLSLVGGTWASPSGALSDPLWQLQPPSQPSNTPPAGGVGVGVGTNGCTDPGGCQEFVGGYYPSGIDVKNMTAIFDPGVYFLDGNLAAESNSCLRPSTATGDGSGGTIFYFHGTGTLSASSNSGSRCAVPYVTSSIKCTASSTVPANLPATLSGNVLLAPCQAPTAGGTNYGDPLGTTDPIGEQRGILFFQNRATTSASPTWSGCGQFGAVGTLYFHNLSAFSDLLSFGGCSGSTSYVVGQVVTDQVGQSGNPSIEMDLNKNALFYVLRVSLLR